MNRQTTLAARLRQAREESGLSQEELGKLFGCSGAAISQMERTKRNISLGTLDRIGVILGKPLDWFLRDEVQPQPRPPIAALSDLEISVKAYVPVYDAAGSGAEPVDFIASSRSHAAPDSWRAYRIDSLEYEPEIRRGDTITVDTGLTPEDDDLVIVMEDGTPVVRPWKAPAGDKVGETKSGYYVTKNDGIKLLGVIVEFHRKRR